ncbi:prostaglandin reductase 1-like [Vanessa tameamea]|uniref:Prostaglandin reductase 1 n=1 Tax=Vanessa tameamea TaxID=334116 RepID=A0A8B8HRL9_VANTA|nr:prostaglandin reductase 1-like [Vanessa tameamea]
MVKAKKYVVKKYFEGVPKRSDFELVEYELPPLKDGEVLVKTEWVSVDPYLRAYNRNVPVPYDQYGFQVGIVEQSNDTNYPVGARIVTHKGWCDYTVVNTSKVSTGNSTEVTYKLPDLKGMSPSIGIGAVGMPGITAYFGFLELCQPKIGETVVVTGAAGAVGSIVGQIAKIKGCKVIGFAGSDDKVKWLEKELGFDKAINYKTADVQKALQAAAPNGVDCYFDNVGGEISSIIMGQMNKRGRVSVCGSISAYNADPTQIPKATILQPSIVFKELRIEGFVVQRWLDRWPEAITQLITWIKMGQLKPAEHVTVGFDKIFDAFVGMLAGENTGKAVVKI